MGWTLDGMTLKRDGVPVEVFESVREMEELIGRLRGAIDERLDERVPGMYADDEQDLYVLRVIKNLHKKGTIVPRSDLMRAACRPYRGINGAELDRILERLLEKGLIAQGMDIVDTKNRSRRKRTRIHYVINTQTQEYDYDGARVEKEALSTPADKKFNAYLDSLREKYGEDG